MGAFKERAVRLAEDAALLRPETRWDAAVRVMRAPRTEEEDAECRAEAEREAASDRAQDARKDAALFDRLGVRGERGRREGLPEAARRAAGERARAWKGRGSLAHAPAPWTPAFSREPPPVAAMLDGKPVRWRVGR